MLPLVYLLSFGVVAISLVEVDWIGYDAVDSIIIPLHLMRQR